MNGDIRKGPQPSHHAFPPLCTGIILYHAHHNDLLWVWVHNSCGMDALAACKDSKPVLLGSKHT